MSLVIVSDVERDHADRVTGDQVNPFLLVIESEGENTIEILDEINPFLLVSGEDHLALGAGLELVIAF